MGRNTLKPLIVFISLITAVAFLAVSVIATWQIFTTLIAGNDIRSELWAFLVLTFTAGVIMISLSWGISEYGEARRAALASPAPSGDDE